MVFSPITLESYAGRCGYQPPAWVTEALKDKSLTPQKNDARNIHDYLDREKRPWLHLVDGGISDNLGLRAFSHALSLVSDPETDMRELKNINASHIIIISVNAHAQSKSDWMLERNAPSLFEVIGSVTSDAGETGHFSLCRCQL